MSNTQPADALSAEHSASAVAEDAACVVSNGSRKTPRPLDDDGNGDGGASSPSHVAKKRRTGSPGSPKLEDVPTSSATPIPTATKSLADRVREAARISLNAALRRNGDFETVNAGLAGLQRPVDSTSATDVASPIARTTAHSTDAHSLNKQIQDLGDASSLLSPKSNSSLQEQSLPILDNLSSQILSLLARSSFQTTTTMVSDPASEEGQAYSTMRSLFEQTRRVYSTAGPFLSEKELGMTDPSRAAIIRKANMTSFLSSIFGAQEIGFPDLNDYFLDIFVPEGGRLLKLQGAIFLELKTQAFIAAVGRGEASYSDLLNHLFPDDLGLKLLGKRPEARHLVPAETDFVKRAWSRRDILLAEVEKKSDAAATLADRYQWGTFLKDLSAFISKTVESLGLQYANDPAPRLSREDAAARNIQELPKKADSSASPSRSGEVAAPERVLLKTEFQVASSNHSAFSGERSGAMDLVARAARAAQIALQGQGLGSRSKSASDVDPWRSRDQPQQPPAQIPQQDQHAQAPSPAPQSAPPHAHCPPPPRISEHKSTAIPPRHPPPTSRPQGPLQFQQYNPNAAPTRGTGMAGTFGYMPGVPHYSQSQPTQVLYERAREATSTKSSPSSRRGGIPSQRRPWTSEEENALMAGLDRVKGPHWSQILAMFGAGGTISEALKDRNQVQLKDKARNLKLFFLKSGIEVPYYLKFVTGELKTRAPNQAAKNEAKERERQQGEEDKAHVAGIEGMMALAAARATSQPGSVPRSPLSHADGLPSPPVRTPAESSPPSAEQALVQSLARDDGKTDQVPQHAVDPALQSQ